jgi:hypothetical protein
MGQEAVEVQCPHCGAPTLFWADPGGGVRQEMIEDCQVCCRPIVFRVEWRGRRPRVRAEALD